MNGEMTKKRIDELRSLAAIRGQEDDTVEEALNECLDEIERLTTPMIYKSMADKVEDGEVHMCPDCGVLCHCADATVQDDMVAVYGCIHCAPEADQNTIFEGQTMKNYIVRKSLEYSVQVQANSIADALSKTDSIPDDQWDCETVDSHVDTDEIEEVE